jgi:regulatory protein
MSPYKKKRKPIYDPETGLPPTEEEIEKMERQAKNVAEYWLGAADRSRKELFTKIKNKGIIDEIANKVLDEYEEKGYIDDERYANQFVHSKTHYEKLGKRSIAFKLREKGVDSDIIEAAISEIDEELEEEQAKELAVRKARTNRRYDNQKRVQQIAGLLSRRGYSGSLIFRLAKEAIEEVDAEWEAEED